MSERLSLPSRRNHTPQKARIANQRTLYISVQDDEAPSEIFLPLKGSDCTSELIGLYDVIARLMSIVLQYGTPLEKLGNLVSEAKYVTSIDRSSLDRSSLFSASKHLQKGGLI